MPLLEVPLYNKLPNFIYDGHFKHINSDLYMFQHAPWFLNSPHLLGWSREIHWLHESGRHFPCKLVGDAFQRSLDKSVYLVENLTSTYTFQQLFLLASEAIQSLEQADILTDAWGCRTLKEWHSERMEEWHKKRAVETFHWELERGLRNQ